jgi:hypothetical protein
LRAKDRITKTNETLMKVIISNNLKVKRGEKQNYLTRDCIQSQEKVSQNFFILKTVEQRNSCKSFSSIA